MRDEHKQEHHPPTTFILLLSLPSRSLFTFLQEFAQSALVHTENPSHYLTYDGPLLPPRKKRNLRAALLHCKHYISFSQGLVC